MFTLKKYVNMQPCEQGYIRYSKRIRIVNIFSLRHTGMPLLCCAILFSGCSRHAEKKDAVVVAVPSVPPVIHLLEIKEKKEISSPVVKIPEERKKKRVEQVQIEKKTVEIPVIHRTDEKVVHEFVHIGEKRYLVPAVWRGHKITEKSPLMSQMRQIPVKFTYEGARIYAEKEACDALVAMAEQALADDILIQVDSAFRSVWAQEKIFIRYMAKGRGWDDLVRYVAPPGYSEHALGTAFDLYPSDWRFADSDTYLWLQEHAHEFGFRETYPKHSSQGFPWEAWHWRYVGTASER